MNNLNNVYHVNFDLYFINKFHLTLKKKKFVSCVVYVRLVCIQSLYVGKQYIYNASCVGRIFLCVYKQMLLIGGAIATRRIPCGAGERLKGFPGITARGVEKWICVSRRRLMRAWILLTHTQGKDFLSSRGCCMARPKWRCIQRATDKKKKKRKKKTKLSHVALMLL